MMNVLRDIVVHAVDRWKIRSWVRRRRCQGSSTGSGVFELRMRNELVLGIGFGINDSVSAALALELLRCWG